MSKQLEITICELLYEEANDKDEFIHLTETEYFKKYSKLIPTKYKEINDFLTEYEDEFQELLGCADGDFILHKEKIIMDGIFLVIQMFLLFFLEENLIVLKVYI